MAELVNTMSKAMDIEFIQRAGSEEAAGGGQRLEDLVVTCDFEGLQVLVEGLAPRSRWVKEREILSARFVCSQSVSDPALDHIFDSRVICFSRRTRLYS